MSLLKIFGISILVVLSSYNFIIFERVFATADDQSIVLGENLYKAKCISCHRIGGGDLVGPDLKEVTFKRDQDWLISFILDPEGMINSGDPISNQLFEDYNKILMPSSDLSRDEVISILDYLEFESLPPDNGKPPDLNNKSEPESPGKSGIIGNQLLGELLFTGNFRFENQGPSCISCHTISSIPLLGGGTLGPDLSRSIEKYSEEGIVSVLSSISFPTMQPIYVDKPLTEFEIIHLKTFLQNVSNDESRDYFSELSILGIMVFVGLILLTRALWRNRFTKIRSLLANPEFDRRSKE